MQLFAYLCDFFCVFLNVSLMLSWRMFSFIDNGSHCDLLESQSLRYCLVTLFRIYNSVTLFLISSGISFDDSTCVLLIVIF